MPKVASKGAGEIATAPVECEDLALWRERELHQGADVLGINGVCLLRLPKKEAYQILATVSSSPSLEHCVESDPKRSSPKTFRGSLLIAIIQPCPG
jgi:hypothetical protein